jgi:hypothetical protein
MRKSRLLFALSLAGLWVLSSLIVPANATVTGRFLYVIGCDAHVDKLDTVAARKLKSFNLAAQTGKEALIPVLPGPLDSCLASQALYDSRNSVFSTAVPVTNDPKADGTKDYRVLTFSVPSMNLVKQVSAGENLDAPPHLEFQAGALKIVKPADWTPQTDIDLAGFAAQKKQIPNQILETSGDRALLRLLTADGPPLVLAVADRNTLSLVRLQDVPVTVAGRVHLAPGGGAALVEETDTANRPTGKLVIFNTTSGKRQKELTVSAIANLYFLAISPTGRVVYHKDDSYRFVNLKMTFGSSPVERPIGKEIPPLFFANE